MNTLCSILQLNFDHLYSSSIPGITKEPNFWDEEIVTLQTKIREMKNLANLEGIQDDLNLYVKIRHNISALLDFLRNVNTRPLHGNNFEPLYQAIQSKITRELQFM